MLLSHTTLHLKSTLYGVFRPGSTEDILSTVTIQHCARALNYSMKTRQFHSLNFTALRHAPPKNFLGQVTLATYLATIKPLVCYHVSSCLYRVLSRVSLRDSEEKGVELVYHKEEKIYGVVASLPIFNTTSYHTQ